MGILCKENFLIKWALHGNCTCLRLYICLKKKNSFSALLLTELVIYFFFTLTGFWVALIMFKYMLMYLILYIPSLVNESTYTVVNLCCFWKLEEGRRCRITNNENSYKQIEIGTISVLFCVECCIFCTIKRVLRVEK